MAQKIDLSQSLDEIIDIASRAGVEQNVFFLTTLDRYRTLVENCAKLKARYLEDGIMVEKTYARGSSNLYAHPAMREYNSTCQQANRTCDTLMKCIKTFSEVRLSDSVEDDDDEL